MSAPKLPKTSNFGGRRLLCGKITDYEFDGYQLGVVMNGDAEPAGFTCEIGYQVGNVRTVFVKTGWDGVHAAQQLIEVYETVSALEPALAPLPEGAVRKPRGRPPMVRPPGGKL